MTMIEKAATDAGIQAAKAAEKGAEHLVKKVFSIMDAAAEKQTPSQYLSEAGIKAVQGKE
jgi:hypothetical protein